MPDKFWRFIPGEDEGFDFPKIYYQIVLVFVSITLTYLLFKLTKASFNYIDALNNIINNLAAKVNNLTRKIRKLTRFIVLKGKKHVPDNEESQKKYFSAYFKLFIDAYSEYKETGNNENLYIVINNIKESKEFDSKTLEEVINRVGELERKEATLSRISKELKDEFKRRLEEL